MNKVLSSTRFVVENAKYVKINHEKIKEFTKHFNESHINHWLNESPFDLTKFNDKDKLHFLLIFNSTSFSYWGNPKWNIEYNNEKFDGSWGMIVALGKAIENNMPLLNMKYLSNISDKDFAKIVKGNIKIPMFEERLRIFREVGKAVTEKLDGDFSTLIKKANNDAMKLLDLIVSNFPSFEDSSLYKGKQIYFYKRVQLLISDIYQMFNNSGYGNLKNIDQLTACADYKLPKVLRNLGIIEYTKDLAAKVDNKIELPHGSEEEIEIRACTIWANEFIKDKLKKTIQNINSIHINDHLWLLGQIKSANDKPYHLTRSTAY